MRSWDWLAKPFPPNFEHEKITFEYRPGGTIDIIVKSGGTITVELSGMPYREFLALVRVMEAHHRGEQAPWKFCCWLFGHRQVSVSGSDLCSRCEMALTVGGKPLGYLSDMTANPWNKGSLR